MCIASPGGPSFLGRVRWRSGRSRKPRVPLRKVKIWEETVLVPTKGKGEGQPHQSVWGTLKHPIWPTHGPQPIVGMPSWRTDSQDFFLLSLTILGQLPVRNSINYCNPFLSRMKEDLSIILCKLLPKASLPPSFIPASPMDGLWNNWRESGSET